MSTDKHSKHTPSDNKQGRARNSNLSGGDHPKSSVGSFEETKDEAFRERESGKNGSGQNNEPRRGIGEKGAGMTDNQKHEGGRGMDGQ